MTSAGVYGEVCTQIARAPICYGRHNDFVDDSEAIFGFWIWTFVDANCFGID